MPTPVVKQARPLTSWSFSRYSDYKQCPARFKYKHLEKREEPAGEAIARGRIIHDAAAAYIKGEGKSAVPSALQSFAVEFKDLRARYKQRATATVVVEDDWAFTREWEPTVWDDWAHCWVRVKLDAAHSPDQRMLHLRDWKTGKLRPELHAEYLEQLELYALVALLTFDWVEEVRPELCYLDLGVVYPEVPLIYKRADIPRLKKLWETRVAPMFKDRLFAPRANSKCRFCHYRKDNGGPCKF